ncbi:hypothetical protein DPMN_044192 [Dreissena polymorpha]|uniref:Uncharacterized protein n=1 Tax=Dreissena polymorpha TaxID=45954 RepID=A0A9D4D432_DREPO|nr:hypothetical protein DPMN_044192 [Dreissena polymorpha]
MDIAIFLIVSGHVYQPTGIIFKLRKDIIGMNLLTEFHEDRTINVASRVKIENTRTINVASRMYTRKNAPPPGGHFHEDQTIYVASIEKNATHLGSHVFQANVTIFELIKDINETNLLTVHVNIHEDWTINVASRELTRQMLTAHDARPQKSDHKSSP